MKESTKKNTKRLLLFIWIILVIYGLFNMGVDVYNFRQLENVKLILKDLKMEDKEFFNLKEFNDIYDVNIKPIKNCYYLRNYNSKDRVPYAFWFKLESLLYKFIYWTTYYTYPKYDIPYRQMCVSGRWCYDGAKDAYIYIISHPCKDGEE